MKIADIPFVVVDIETTGSSAYNGGIIEIAACKISNHKIIDTFHSLVNPKKRIPFYITWMTGITNRTVAKAPVFPEIAEDFYDFLGKAVFVAHNVNFDFEFVKNALLQSSFPVLSNTPLCTIKLARRIFPGFSHYNLQTLARNLGVLHDRPHRALDDCLATAKILLLMLEKLQQLGISDTAELERIYHCSPDECRDYFANGLKKQQLQPQNS